MGNFSQADLPGRKRSKAKCSIGFGGAGNSVKPELGQQLRAGIIIPVHNDAETLPTCLDAVLPEIRPEGWELIVVDDCSSDGSARAAEERGVRVLRLPENRGVAGARNAGAAAVDAEILVFVDADICPSPGSLTAMVEALCRRPEIHAVGAYPLTGDLGPSWSSHFVGLRSSWGYEWKDGENERRFSSIQSECGAIRTKTFRELGGFSERYKGVGMEEFQMAHEMEERGYGHLLLRAASYRHHYKPLSRRCRALCDRTARWVPLFFRRRKFESPGAVGTPGASVSCLLTVMALAGLVAGVFFPPALFLAAAAWLAQIVVERGFFRFAAATYGRLMPVYGFFALQVLHVAIFLGFLRGLWRIGFRRLRPGEGA